MPPTVAEPSEPSDTGKSRPTLRRLLQVGEDHAGLDGHRVRDGSTSRMRRIRVSERTTDGPSCRGVARR
ncbi:hypothetical protein [Janibacter melonis]|uniref:hypothetical protein n=1 Tax=Janibacter melonis TaxID=262209 RepID=UPI00209550CB|nr:hypothetical protein [Janibacter melonis]